MWSAAHSKNPNDRPRQGWHLAQLSPEHWVHDSGNGRTHYAWHHPDSHWSYSADQFDVGQPLGWGKAASRGEAMDAALAIPDFAPFDWTQLDAEGYEFQRQYVAGFCVDVSYEPDAQGNQYGFEVSSALTGYTDYRYAYGTAPTLDDAKAAAEASWARGPIDTDPRSSEPDLTDEQRAVIDEIFGPVSYGTQNQPAGDSDHAAQAD